jgi:hypothetical protein
MLKGSTICVDSDVSRSGGGALEKEPVCIENMLKYKKLDPGDLGLKAIRLSSS